MSGVAVQIIPRQHFGPDGVADPACECVLKIGPAAVELTLATLAEVGDAVTAYLGGQPGGARSIDVLGLSTRAYYCLKREGIHTVGDLAGRSERELLGIPNLGAASVAEIKHALAADQAGR